MRSLPFLLFFFSGIFLFSSASQARITCVAGWNAASCQILNASAYVAYEKAPGVLVSTLDPVAIPAGYQDGSNFCSVTDTSLSASNIKRGINLFGVIGTDDGTYAANTPSNAYRSQGSAQITLEQENILYAAGDLPPTYSDIPDINTSTDSASGIDCTYAARPSVNCGTTQSTLNSRIADCAVANPASSLWDGAVKCNGGESTWKLVTRSGANKEVWRDEKTGLLWSSVTGTTNFCRASGNTQAASFILKSAYNTSAGTMIIGNGQVKSLTGGPSQIAETLNLVFTNATNFTLSSSSGCGGGAIVSGALSGVAGSNVTWARAGFCSFQITQGAIPFSAGDTLVFRSEAAATFSCEPGAASALQPSSPLSYCAEALGLSSGLSENWAAGIYDDAKGKLGKNSVPSVSWRVPTVHDFHLATVDGLLSVMPDLALAGINRPLPDGSPGSQGIEITATLDSGNRFQYSPFNGLQGATSISDTNANFNQARAVRCVGR